MLSAPFRVSGGVSVFSGTQTEQRGTAQAEGNAAVRPGRGSDWAFCVCALGAEAPMANAPRDGSSG